MHHKIPLFHHQIAQPTNCKCSLPPLNIYLRDKTSAAYTLIQYYDITCPITTIFNAFGAHHIPSSIMLTNQTLLCNAMMMIFSSWVKNHLSTHTCTCTHTWFFTQSTCHDFGYTSQLIYPGDNLKFAARPHVSSHTHTHTKCHLHDPTQ